MLGGATMNLTPRLLLLCVLLAAQSVTFAHEFDHSAAGDGAPCTICKAGSNLNAAAADTGGFFPAETPDTPQPCLQDSIRPHVFRVLVPARAPPSSL